MTRLVYYTTQEYLLEHRGNLFPKAQVNISQACIPYLSMKPSIKGPCTNIKDLLDPLKKYDTLEYASRYWPNHVCGDPEEIKTMSLTFLENTLSIMPYDQVVLYLRQGWKRVINHTYVTDLNGQTALLWAAANGNLAVIKSPEF